jgi:hypothetical protein
MEWALLTEDFSILSRSLPIVRVFYHYDETRGVEVAERQ